MREPYDQQAKLLLEDNPRLVLELLSGVPRDAPATVDPVERELIVPTRRVDHAYRVRLDDEDWIEHFEATTSFRYVDLKTVYRRTTLLGAIYDVGVRTRILLMTEESAPADWPTVFEADDKRGNYRRHDVTWVLVWKMSGRQALEMEWPALLPWVCLMDATEEEQDQALRIARQDRDLAARATVLYTLRYGKEEARRRFDWMNSFLTDEIMRHSPIVQDWLQQGRVEGEAVGEANEARKILRSLLQEKFGEIAPWADTRIRDATTLQLEVWGRRLIRATSIEETLS